MPLSRAYPISTGGSALPTPISASTTIPLDGNKTMPRRFVSSVLAFTTGATVNGGACVLPLVADGTNAPTFTGFTEAGGSAGYVNTSGILNLIQFFFLDGTPYYSISQAVNAQPISTPTISTVAVPDSAPGTMAFTFTAALDGTKVPAASAFALTSSGAALTASAVAVSGTVVTLTLNRVVTAGETITASYTAPSTNPLQDTSGSAVPSFSGRTVANNVVNLAQQSANVPSAAAGTMQIVFNAPLDTTSVPAASAFTIANSGGTDTVSAVSISGSTVTLTKSRTTISGDTLTVSYTAPGTNPLKKASNGSLAASFTNFAVTNNIASALFAGAKFIRLPNVQGNCSEAVDPAGGYDYSSTLTNYSVNADGAVSTIVIPAATAGFVGDKLTSLKGGSIIGVTTNTSAGFQLMTYGIYAENSQGNGNYQTLGMGTTTALVAAVGDLKRVRSDGAGGWFAEVSKNNGTSWTSIASVTGGSTAAQKASVHVTSNGISNPFGSNNMA